MLRIIKVLEKKKKNNPKDINSGYIGYVHGLEDSNS